MKKCHQCNKELTTGLITFSYSHDGFDFCSTACIYAYDLDNNAPLYEDNGGRYEELYLNRTVWMREFKELLELIDYGEDAYKSDTFEVMPYYWGANCTCEEDKDCTCLCSKPNFIHKASGLELKWYKYPFRDSYANKIVTLKELRLIVSDCIKDVKCKE